MESKKKSVFVSVYVEKPRNRRSSTTNYNIHNHHYHLHIEQSKNSGCYNRRAELLSYSHHLQEVAKSTRTSSSLHQPKSLAILTRKEQQHSPEVILSCIVQSKESRFGRGFHAKFYLHSNLSSCR